VIAIVGIVAIVAVVVARRRRARRLRAHAATVAAVPELLELLVALVRAGCTPAEAMRRVAPRAPIPVAEPLARVIARLDQGQRFADALHELAVVVPAARPAVDLLATADRYGLPLAPVLDRLADEARAQRRRLGEAQARELPVRLAFPLVCCTLPSFAVLTVVPIVVASLGSLPGLGP
jgi:pilus assembly protein TadC